MYYQTDTCETNIDFVTITTVPCLDFFQFCYTSYHPCWGFQGLINQCGFHYNKITPIINHFTKSFYRKCFMQLKTFTNLR